MFYFNLYVYTKCIIRTTYILYIYINFPLFLLFICIYIVVPKVWAIFYPASSERAKITLEGDRLVPVVQQSTGSAKGFNIGNRGNNKNRISNQQNPFGYVARSLLPSMAVERILKENVIPSHENQGPVRDYG